MEALYKPQREFLSRLLNQTKTQRDAATLALTECLAEATNHLKHNRSELQRTVGDQAPVVGSLITMGQEHLTTLGVGLETLLCTLQTCRSTRNAARREEHTVLAEEVNRVVQTLTELVQRSAQRMHHSETIENKQHAGESKVIQAIRQGAGTLWNGIDTAQTRLKQHHQTVCTAFQRDGIELKTHLGQLTQMGMNE